MKKRLISFFMTLCMAVSVIPMLSIPASAQLTSRTDWNPRSDNRTINLITPMNKDDDLVAAGWHDVGDQINSKAYKIPKSDGGDEYDNPVGIQADYMNDDIGDSEYGGGVYWQINFSNEDKVKINKGDLYLNSSARYWIQGISAIHKISIRFFFYNDTQSEPIDRNI